MYSSRLYTCAETEGQKWKMFFFTASFLIETKFTEMQLSY